MNIKLLGSGLASSMLSTLVPQAQTEEVGDKLTLILDPQGNDANNGLSLETPIQTLVRAQEIIAKSCSETPRDVDIRIMPGEYVNQTVEWFFTMPNYSIRFISHHKSGQVKFTGQGGTWFTLSHSKGQKTNLHFENLWIQNYQIALSFNGDRSNQEMSNSHNKIYDCVFQDIGDVSYPGQSRSTACIRLLNSGHNHIQRNRFVNIISWL